MSGNLEGLGNLGLSWCSTAAASFGLLLQMGDVDQSLKALTELAKLPALRPQLLTVMVRDGINNGTVELAYAMVTQLFELTHALEPGSKPQIPISELSVSSGDLLRTSLQLLSVPSIDDTSAQRQLDCCIGQPCDWSHITTEEGFNGLQTAGFHHAIPTSLVLLNC
jgi:hypothetical protein